MRCCLDLALIWVGRARIRTYGKGGHGVEASVPAGSQTKNNPRYLYACSCLPCIYALVRAGHRMAFWENTSSWVSTEHCQPVSAWAKIPLFLSTITCFNILMKGAPAQWLGMLCVAAISFLTINLAPTLHNMSSSSSTVLAAFFVGVAGNLYAYATNSPALIPILSGIFLIVPGGMSVKGVKAWINNDLNGGLAFGSGIVMIAVSISIGLFASSVLMYKPRMKISNAVFF